MEKLLHDTLLGYVTKLCSILKARANHIPEGRCYQAHYHKDVRDFLNEQFPGRWIGKREPIAWQARSSYLTQS